MLCCLVQGYQACDDFTSFLFYLWHFLVKFSSIVYLCPFCPFRIKGVPVRGSYFSNGTGNPDIPMIFRGVKCSMSNVRLGQAIDHCDVEAYGVMDSKNCGQDNAAGVICVDTGNINNDLPFDAIIMIVFCLKYNFFLHNIEFCKVCILDYT